MGTMKNFRKYALWIIGLFIISTILENALIADMYKPINGIISENVVFKGQLNTDLEVKVSDARATNMNGYLVVHVKNITGKYIEKCCAKIELFTERGVLASTKYVDMSKFEVNETRQFKINFKGQYISSYAISLIEDAPDKSYILDILGWEIDLRNVLGMDFSSVINPANIKETGLNVWNVTLNFLNTIPIWAYMIATGITIWFMPKGFLFGLFPF